MSPVTSRAAPGERGVISPADLALLRQLERKILWLATWMIHHANNVRPGRGGLKIGGHQSSSASVVSILAALYLHVLRPEDRVAIKPHAAPVFHAAQYLLGKQTRENLERFRAMGGAQSYPSRTKDACRIDISTGSVGLGAAAALFTSLVQDYVRARGLVGEERDAARMIAVVGDAELDEGNVYEALLEGWKHNLKNVWWIVDYNRQSLDGVVNDDLFRRIQGFFQTVDWQVVTIKFGKRLQALSQHRAGDAILGWIDRCPNQLYSALVFKGGAAFRQKLTAELAGVQGLGELLDRFDDAALGSLMSNLGGHDIECLLEAFHGATPERPHCFVAYTIKGHGLPFAGHKDNHSGLLTRAQMNAYRDACGIASGDEWDPFAGLEVEPQSLRRFLADVPFVQTSGERSQVPVIECPPIAAPVAAQISTQEAFGRLLADIARERTPLVDRIVTTSPDVSVSTNLSGWVNRRGVFSSVPQRDVFREESVPSVQKWEPRPAGQHIELGIAENNFFLLLSQLGLAHELFGARLLPIGTLYDPFISRGLDALSYACYQGSRFLLVATPSGMALAPEGGAHQSIYTPLIGIGQPGLTYFEPAFSDELAAILQWSLQHVQAQCGGAVYLRLSTRPLEQPVRTVSQELRDAFVQGGYWMKEPGARSPVSIVAMGAALPEALAAHAAICADFPDSGLLVITAPGRLHEEWLAVQARRASGTNTPDSLIERLLAQLPAHGSLVSVLDGHPATLSWLGSVRNQSIAPLGVTGFGESADIPDLFRLKRIDTAAILDATAELLLRPSAVAQVGQ